MISQDDRDRIEDLGLDPNADRTEDLRQHAQLVEAAKRVLRSDTPPYAFSELVDRMVAAAQESGPGSAATDHEGQVSPTPHMKEEDEMNTTVPVRPDGTPSLGDLRNNLVDRLADTKPGSLHNLLAITDLVEGDQLTADEFTTICCRHGRNAGPHLLLDYYFGDLIDDVVLSQVIGSVWSSAEFPGSWLTRVDWIDLFRHAGYTEDGERTAPPSEITLYRGCPPSRTRGMSWTSDREVAQWFAERFRDRSERRNSAVYTTTVGGAQVLAKISGRNEFEYVIDTTSISVTRAVTA
jgi:hypothetical protein